MTKLSSFLYKSLNCFKTLKFFFPIKKIHSQICDSKISVNKVHDFFLAFFNMMKDDDI